MALALLLITAPVYAQAAGAAHPENQWIPIAAGIGMAIAAAGCGIGQGKAAASAAEAVARNPGARASIQLFLIFGLAFIESLALFTFVMIFLKAKPIM